MKYLGSKRRIAKHILPIMLEAAERAGIKKWVEPFVGGANMIDKVPVDFERVGIDLNEHTIEALKGIRDLVFNLPESVTEEEYKALIGAPPDPITSWVRYVYSFGSMFGASYAKNKRGDDYGQQGINSAVKQSPNLQDVKLITGSFDDYEFNNSLIYCDPPYEGRASYKTGKIDHDKFWEWCREQSKNNIVYISEYQAPKDFECVWQGEVKTNFANQNGNVNKAVEKLFTLNRGQIK